MATTTTPTERERAALRAVENAARRVVRYPNDRAPKVSLANALRKLDKARQED